MHTEFLCENILSFCAKTHHLGAVSHRFHGDIIVVSIASIATLILGISIHRIRHWKLTINWIGNTGVPYHWLRSNGSVSVEMSSGGHESDLLIPRWIEEAATLEALRVFDEEGREILVWSSTSPRLTQKQTHT